MDFNKSILVLLLSMCFVSDCSALVISKGPLFLTDREIIDGQRFKNCSQVKIGRAEEIYIKISNELDIVVFNSGHTYVPIGMGPIVPIIPTFFLAEEKPFSINIIFYGMLDKYKEDFVQRSIKVSQENNDIRFKFNIITKNLGIQCAEKELLKNNMQQMVKLIPSGEFNANEEFSLIFENIKIKSSNGFLVTYTLNVL